MGRVAGSASTGLFGGTATDSIWTTGRWSPEQVGITAWCAGCDRTLSAQYMAWTPDGLLRCHTCTGYNGWRHSASPVSVPYITAPSEYEPPADAVDYINHYQRSAEDDGYEIYRYIPPKGCAGVIVHQSAG